MESLPGVPAMPPAGAGELRIVRGTEAERAFTVVGPRGALLGEQSGRMEGWVFPWKLFSNIRISARMEGYPVPIDVNGQSATIEVRPDRTVITYAHANFTVRQVMLAPKYAEEGLGAVAWFEVEAVRPTELTFSFQPEMKPMWPAASAGTADPEWVETAGGSGFYLLHLSLPGEMGAMAMPGAEPGIQAPYQERPKEYPTQFVVRFDPKRDAGVVYPLLMTMGEGKEATTEALHARLMTADRGLAAAAAANRARYDSLLAGATAIETPDKQLDEAFRWAEVSIDQLQVDVSPKHEETALTAGFLESGDSARPGFGWFFGRDALWTLYAVNSYGDFGLSRREMEFLLKRQRADGKILHEYSQTADRVDWGALPYEWAAADATPMLLMAMGDYVSVSGDRAFAEAHWGALEKAWAFMAANDADGDGIYDNSQGTAWVESWPPGMPKQELYLAAIDEQAALAYAKLARVLGHEDVAKAAEAKASAMRPVIEREYFQDKDGSYAFSHNPDGSVDGSATIFPTVAWWDGSYALAKPEAMLGRWASSEFSTDWGTRDLSPSSTFYDPISYHQGTVWPLYTGWASVAQYRAGRPVAGYAALMQNAGLTWAGDLGNVTELLSGEFYAPLGRSTVHQLWSAAMVVSPVLRGMFGLQWDAAGKMLTVNPQLPAAWGGATLRRVPVGAERVDVSFRREGGAMVVRADGVGLKSSVAGAAVKGGVLRIPLPAVEVGMEVKLPEPGSVTLGMKVVSQTGDGRSAILKVEGMAGSTGELQVRRNRAGLRVMVDGTALGAGEVVTVPVVFGAGSGYVEKMVEVRW